MKLSPNLPKMMFLVYLCPRYALVTLSSSQGLAVHAPTSNENQSCSIRITILIYEMRSGLELWLLEISRIAVSRNLPLSLLVLVFTLVFTDLNGILAASADVNEKQCRAPNITPKCIRTYGALVAGSQVQYKQVQFQCVKSNMYKLNGTLQTVSADGE